MRNFGLGASWGIAEALRTARQLLPPTDITPLLPVSGRFFFRPQEHSYTRQSWEAMRASPNLAASDIFGDTRSPLVEWRKTSGPFSRVSEERDHRFQFSPRAKGLPAHSRTNLSHDLKSRCPLV